MYSTAVLQWIFPKEWCDDCLNQNKDENGFAANRGDDDDEKAFGADDNDNDDVTRWRGRERGQIVFYYPSFRVCIISRCICVINHCVYVLYCVSSAIVCVLCMYYTSFCA